MAEMVMRHGRKRKERMLDARRITFPVPNRDQLRTVILWSMQCIPVVFLSMAELLGMPSGLGIAYGAALAAMDKPVTPVLVGSAAVILLRLLAGVDPRWEMLISLAMLWTARLVVFGRRNGVMMGYIALLLLPMAVRGSLANTAAEMLQAWGGTAVAALSGPLLFRGMKALMSRKKDGSAAHIDSMEDRLCVGYLAVLMICGGSRLLAFGINIGMMLASGALILLAGSWGSSAGCTAGMLTGVVMALQGLSPLMSVSLAAGGYLAGVARITSRRWMGCVGFLMGSLIVMIMSKTTGTGCGNAALAASLCIIAMPRQPHERIRAFFQRFTADLPVPGDAYAASMLAAWERTVDAMALAMPSPVEPEPVHDDAWWEEKLCDGCPDRSSCGCMCTELASSRAQTVWECRDAEDSVWRDALELLRGLGCRRLHQLQHSMDCLRQEDAVRQRSIRSACYQRDMLVTHLTAMAGAARRFAYLSAGENWWDTMVAVRIRQELSQAASPVRLSWVRRVNGHVQLAFELGFITGARKQAEELCELVEAVVDAPMQVIRVDGERVQLAEQPPLVLRCGCSAAPMGPAESSVSCGDTAWCGLLQDGRYMAALSDGMGHGEKAALASRQTVELLRLCLDAGYTRTQTLTAVNGMMLLGGHGERFTTVDMLIADLWTGHVVLDKLGAAGSWLYQKGELQQLTGDALPLGILENIESRQCRFSLSAGDAIILLSDGVEEAFSDFSALQNAILFALGINEPKDTAEQLLRSAQEKGGGERADDQSVIVLRAETYRCTSR